jgi:hypothetical protein
MPSYWPRRWTGSGITWVALCSRESGAYMAAGTVGCRPNGGGIRNACDPSTWLIRHRRPNELSRSAALFESPIGSKMPGQLKYEATAIPAA